MVRSRSVLRSVCILVASLSLMGPARGQAGCQPSWLPTFGQTLGVDSYVEAFATFDDGSGAALYAAGYFTTAGGVAANRIAKWNGSSWSPLGSGLNGIVDALTVFDDGSGPALYAGGSFTMAGAVQASLIAKWDGSNWSALGNGLHGGGSLPPFCSALAVYDDGSGPALYAGGYFFSAGGAPATGIAKWNGSSWTEVGGGIGGSRDVWIDSLAVFDDGGQRALCASGGFSLAGGVPANGIAQWDGSSWEALGSGLDGTAHALLALDDGSGQALYAGGSFTTAGGVAASKIARWNGSTWEVLGSGMSGGIGPVVDALAEFDDGSGPVLVAGGDFTTAGGVLVNHVAKWTGSSWEALGTGVSGGDFLNVHALTVFGDGSSRALFAGGDFTTAGSVPVNNIARWNGSSWEALGDGMTGWVEALSTYDDGSGQALYAGGTFTIPGDAAASYVAKWHHGSWSALGAGMDGPVEAFTVFDDGSGPVLYVGGSFDTAGGVPANSIAAWNGSSWSALGAGMDGPVEALTVFDDGSGPALFAGGDFTFAGGVPANCIAKWNGSSWSALGSGLTGFNPGVRALAVWDDGGGAALYAGGTFNLAGGVEADRIAKWDGLSWSGLGSDMQVSVEALAVFDDGSGPALYVGGGFITAGGVLAHHVARWNGSTWSALGTGFDNAVGALTVFDDGNGSALYAGGSFTMDGGVDFIEFDYIARWNGFNWSPLGSGMSDTVEALVAFDDGGGPALYAGGRFESAKDSFDSFVAKWACASIGVWIDLGSALPGTNGDPLLLGTGELTPGSAGAVTLNRAAPWSPSLLAVALQSTPISFKCGTLVPAPVLLSFVIQSGSAGEAEAGWTSWPAELSGVRVYFQFAILDKAAVCGVALSNALLADVP